MDELRIFDAPPAERADAARNRSRILRAAETLFAKRAIDEVSMDEIAAAAGVGKGTLYRRFGDKSGLGIAILDARERELQEAIIRGPPPLGPGAPAQDRLLAFVSAYLGYLERNLTLLVMCEAASPGARYRSAVYAGWHRYLSMLLREAGIAEDNLIAHLILALLDADLHDTVGDGSPQGWAKLERVAQSAVGCLIATPGTSNGPAS